MGQFLSEILRKFNQEQQRQFSIFVSGQSKLRFAELSPKMKVVIKEDGLPSVMTCAHYLKVRKYTDIEMFERELKFAMMEGSEFHLS